MTILRFTYIVPYGRQLLSGRKRVLGTERNLSNSVASSRFDFPHELAENSRKGVVMRNLTVRQWVALPAMLVAFGACSSGEIATEGQEDDLTSLTARARTLKFEGYVYVEKSAQDWSILNSVRKQTQSAFGALRTSDVGVNDRELATVDPASFVKTTVKVVDPSNPSASKEMVKVKYTYTATSVVPKSMSTRSTLSLAVLTSGYSSQTSRILKECTANDKEAKEFQESIWYVFDPSLSQCKTAMKAEQARIDADRARLGSVENAVPQSEVSRLYLPLTMGFSNAATNRGTTYPEYDRLYAGGVQSGKLVIGMVSGLMADWAAGEKHDTIDDSGYKMWFQGLRAIFKARPGLKYVKADPSIDIGSYTVGTVKVTGATFDDLLKWELDGTGFPTGITSANSRALRVLVAERLVRHWITFEAPVSVKVGSAAAKKVTIQLNSYFGASTDDTPHKRGIKNSDLFVYNGHSYIGYGPLDPSNFSSRDFPSSYQVLNLNGCVSYNYYDADYYALKPGGTANLETVTNGLESYVYGSGEAMGRYVGAFIDGKQNSYTSILKATQFTDFGYDWGMDALRVVEGEIDNKYKPTTTPIVVSSVP